MKKLLLLIFLPFIIGWGICPTQHLEDNTDIGRWQSWGENAEKSLATKTTYVALMDGVNAGDDEKGTGGEFEAETGLTSFYTVPGATGDYRAFTNVNHAFYTSDNIYRNVLTDNTWTIIIKVADITLTANRFICVYDSPDSLFIKTAAAGITFTIHRPAVLNVKMNQTTAALPPNTGTVYICFWSDGTYCRGGWSKTKPKKWSDFQGNNRVSTTLADAYISDSNQAYDYGLGGINASVIGKYYYLILSKECLIKNY